MPAYSSSQIATLRGYIAGAQAALANGDTQNALNYVNLYYNSQTDIRGYATDALQVVNNVGLFGTTANQEVTNAIGISEYGAVQPRLQVDLAAADFQIIQANPNAVPTANQIADYHANVFANDGIPLTAWGGAAGAALG
ncbi:MAG: hypothetical protein QOF41_2647 [Methylobacteriaceae bacterium]|nr:hypothetical protein [Methylobacteriaceae bacterium]